MGKISVVGIGPGSLDDMTYRARRTIEEATTVVGYKRYVDLIAELVEGKKVLDTGMTQVMPASMEWQVLSSNCS